MSERRGRSVEQVPYQCGGVIAGFAARKAAPIGIGCLGGADRVDAPCGALSDQGKHETVP